MFIFKGLISGIIATLIFDIFQISLSYAYNINKSRWDLIGRYFLGFKEKKYIREDLENDERVKNELLFGYIFHYIIGMIFGIIYVTINLIFYNHPSIILALIIGFSTVIGSWCILMPFAFNTGFFANKKEESLQIMVSNLIAHFIFGIGLYLGFVIIY